MVEDELTICTERWFQGLRNLELASSRCLLQFSTNSGTGETDSHGSLYLIMVKSRFKLSIKDFYSKKQKTSCQSELIPILCNWKKF